MTETTDVEGHIFRHHSGFDFKTLRELKMVVAQYGSTAPYTLAILDSVASQWLMPIDWQTLAQATLCRGIISYGNRSMLRIVETLPDKMPKPAMLGTLKCWQGRALMPPILSRCDMTQGLMPKSKLPAPEPGENCLLKETSAPLLLILNKGQKNLLQTLSIA